MHCLMWIKKVVTQSFLNGLNLAIQTATNGLGATFVPTAHLFEANNYLVPNPIFNIHPNEAGYVAIAGNLMGEIRQVISKG